MEKTVSPITLSSALLAELRVKWHPNGSQHFRLNEAPLVIVQLVEAIADQLAMDLDAVQTTVDVVKTKVQLETTSETFLGVVSQTSGTSLMPAPEVVPPSLVTVVKRDNFEVRPNVYAASFDPVYWLIDPPGLAALLAVPKYYWKIVADDVVEMTQLEKDVIDAARLPTLKALKIKALGDETLAYIISQGYTDAIKMSLTALLADAYGTGKANRVAYITPALDWITVIQLAYVPVKDAVVAATTAAEVDAVSFDLASFTASNPLVTPEGALAIPD